MLPEKIQISFPNNGKDHFFTPTDFLASTYFWQNKLFTPIHFSSMGKRQLIKTRHTHGHCTLYI